jgi:hypothetical protein
MYSPLLYPNLTSFNNLKALRVIRTLRLVKLARLFKSSRLIKRWETRIAMPYASLRIVALFIKVIYSMHLVACLLALQTSFEPSRLDSWMGVHGYCTDASHPHHEPTADGSEPPHLGEIGEICVPVGAMYLASIYWSMGLVLGTSANPLPGPYAVTMRPHGASSDGLDHSWYTTSETAVLVSCLFLGSVLWAYVTSCLVDIIVNTDPDATNFRNFLDDVPSTPRARRAHAARTPRTRRAPAAHFLRSHAHHSAHATHTPPLSAPLLARGCHLQVNRFVGFFKLDRRLAMQLRAYAHERRITMMADSRSSVVSVRDRPIERRSRTRCAAHVPCSLARSSAHALLTSRPLARPLVGSPSPRSCRRLSRGRATRNGSSPSPS